MKWIVSVALKVWHFIYLMGENEIIASKEYGFLNRLAVTHVSNGLKICMRHVDEVFVAPHKQLLNSGMTYEI